MKPISRGSKAGFTLVELIVVIAILAILAGVAIPVYSGYIEKANQAADETLLAAVNSAYAAACLENDKDPRTVSASATLSDGKLTGVAPYNDSFARYFAGNENSQFKHFASLIYNRTDGVFKGYGEGEAITFAIGDTTLTVDAALMSAYLGSTFDNMGSTELTKQIDKLTNSAMAAILEGHGETLLSSQGFQAFLQEKGITLDPNSENYEKMASNALVLYAASIAKNKTVDEWMSSLETNGCIVSTAEPGDKALAMAVQYAMLTAYCSDPNATFTTRSNDITHACGKLSDLGLNKDDDAGIRAWVTEHYGETANYKVKLGSLSVIVPGEETTINAHDWYESQTSSSEAIITGLLNTDGMWNTFHSSTEFSDYYANQANTDLSAFLSALQIVDDNTSNVNLDELLLNGWYNEGQDDGVAALIRMITGN